MPPIARNVYERWAEHYDTLYRGLVDYEGDVRFLEAVFRRHKVAPTSILDIGCGTGSHAIILARRGHEVTGVDRSPKMLAIARKKARGVRPRPRFIKAEMESFRLGRTFDAAICMFGGFGYLVRRSDAARCLSHVGAHLVPRGLFVFEYWQTSAVRPGRQSWLHRTGPGLEILRLSESAFDRRRSLLAIDFQFLVLRGRTVVDRFVERHMIRTYSRQEIRSLLRGSGLRRLGEFAATPGHKGFAPVTADTFRIVAVARQGQS